MVISYLEEDNLDEYRKNYGNEPGMLTSDNPLFKYDSVTYHIKLFTSREFQGKVFASDDSESLRNIHQTLILAETGVTDIMIDNLRFNTVYSLTNETYTAQRVTFSFELREALGVTLLDRFKYAADVIGSKDFIKMPFFLELTFRGRDPNTGEPVIIDDGTKSVIPIQIIDMVIEADQGGTVYLCEAVRANDYGFNDSIGMAHKGVTAYGDNAKSILDDLFTTLSSDKYAEQNSANFQYEPIDTYKVEFDGFPAEELKFVEFSDVEKTDRSGPMHKTDDGKTALTVTESAAINAVIDSVMSNTIWLQKNINEVTASEGGESGNDTNSCKDNLNNKKIYRIRSDVTLGNYVSTVGDFKRSITYRISPVSVGRGADSQVNPAELSRKKVPVSAEAPYAYPNNFDEGAIIRRYDYLYTGGNRSVLNFDFKINLAWFAAMPRQAGFHTNSTTLDAGTQVPNSTVHPSHRKRKEEVLDKPCDVKAPTNAIVADSGKTAKEFYKDQNRDLSIIGLSENNPLLFNEFAQDGGTFRLPGSKGVSPPQYVSLKDLTGLPAEYPMSFRALPHENAVVNTMEPTRGGAQQKTTSLLASYVNTENLEFIGMHLEIVGDPHWYLGAPRYPGTLYFMFLTGLPTEPGPDGYIKMNRNNMISGVYQIVSVDNVFEGGKFTQTLYGVRDIRAEIVGQYATEVDKQGKTAQEFYSNDPSLNTAPTAGDLPGLFGDNSIRNTLGNGIGQDGGTFSSEALLGPQSDGGG